MNVCQFLVRSNASGVIPTEHGFRRSLPNRKGSKDLAHRRTFRAFVAAAALLAGGCSGGGGAGAPITPNSGGGGALTNAQSILPQSAGSGSANKWQLGVSSWVPASDGQCGSQATSNGGATLELAFTPAATRCYRDMANPSPTNFVSNGTPYTWTFQIVGKTAVDTNPNFAGLVWQLHGYNNGGSPCTGLLLTNYPSGVEHWGFSDCAGTHLLAPYVDGQAVNFVIHVTPSLSSGRPSSVYMNGKLVFSGTNATAVTSSGPGGADWWDFGPYWYRFRASQPQSSATHVDFVFNGMTLTSP